MVFGISRNLRKHELLQNTQGLRWAVPVQLVEWGKPFIHLTVDSILAEVECMTPVQGSHLWAAQASVMVPLYIRICL